MKRTTSDFEDESSNKQQKSEADEDYSFEKENPLEEELRKLMKDENCDEIISFLEKHPNEQTDLLDKIANNPTRYHLDDIATKNGNVFLLEWTNKNHPKFITSETFKDAIDYETFESYIWLKENRDDIYSKLSSKEKYRGESKIERYLKYKKERESKTLIDGFNDAPIDKVTSNMEKSKAKFYFKEAGVKYCAKLSWDEWRSASVEVFDGYGISVSFGDVVFHKRISERVLHLSGTFARLAETATDKLEELGEYDIWERCNYNTSECSSYQ